jgi:hypothetical protein
MAIHGENIIIGNRYWRFDWEGKIESDIVKSVNKEYGSVTFKNL